MASTAETLHMSIGEVEEKFNQAQLVMMSVIQELNYEQMKQETGGGGKRGGKILNKAATPEEQNAKAWKYL